MLKNVIKSWPYSLLLAVATFILAGLGVREVLIHETVTGITPILLLGAIITALLFWGSVTEKYTE